MIADPYKVLGVSESVSDADLKKAYRELSKKWHPDANPDHPAEAEERFKQIQEAYRQIVDARARGTSAYGSAQSTGGGYSSGGQRGYADYSGFGGFEEFFSQWAQYSEGRRAEEESNEIRAARNYINAGHYREALNALNLASQESRTARWYYFAAIANQGLGNNIDALNHAKRAVDMDPGNAEYATLLNRLQNGGTWYQDRGASYGFGGMGNSTMSYCMWLCGLNLLCNCFGMRWFLCC